MELEKLLLETKDQIVEDNYTITSLKNNDKKIEEILAKFQKLEEEIAGRDKNNIIHNKKTWAKDYWNSKKLSK